VWVGHVMPFSKDQACGVKKNNSSLGLSRGHYGAIIQSWYIKDFFIFYFF
jgi:hypothetical protein